MPSNFELIGVEAIIAGVAAFERDANTVNKLLNQINNTTQGLASGNAFNILGSAAGTAFSAIVAGSAAAVTALAGVSVGAVEVAASFEQSVLRTAAVTGASADNIRALGDSVIQVGNDSRLGLSEIADAENSLARAGFSATDITNGLLEATTKFAEASGGKLGAAQAADLMSEAIKAYGLSGGEATKVADALTGAVNSSVIRYGDLSIILRQVVPIAAAMNIPISDLATSIGLLGQAGISGSVAGSALKDVLVKLADPSKIAAQEMKKYGITIQDTKGNILPFREVIDTLNKSLGDQAVATGKVTAEQRLQILANAFGTRGVEAALALVRGGAPAFDQMAKAIANTDVNKLADDMRNSLFPQLDRLKNIIQGFVVDTGLPLEQALTTSITKVNDLLAKLDPRIPKLFGDALLAAFSGQGVGTTEFNASAILGPSFGATFNGVLDVLLAVRSAILDDIIPAFHVLFDTIVGGSHPVADFGGTLEQLARTIRAVGQDIATGIEYVAAFITVVRDSGIIPAVIAGLVIGFNNLYNSIVLLPSIVSALLVTAFGELIKIIDKVKATLSSLQTVLSDIGIALVVVGGLLATVFVVDRINAVALTLRVLQIELILTYSHIVPLVGILVDLAGSLAILVAQDIAAAASLVYFSVTAVGNAIISVGALVASLVRLGGYFLADAILIISEGALVAASFIAQAAAAIAYTIGVYGLEAALGLAGVALAVFGVATLGVEGALVVLGSAISAVGVVIALFASGTITSAIASVASFGAAIISGIIPATISLAEAFVTSSLSVVGSLAAMVVAALSWGAATVGAIAIAIDDAVYEFALMGTSAIAAAADVSLAFLVTIPGAVVAGVATVVATIGPFLLGLAAIVGVIVLVYEAWTNNWLGIQGVVKSAVQFILDRIGELLRTIEQIPFVKDALDKAGAAFEDLRSTATGAMAGVETETNNLLGQANVVFPSIESSIIHFAGTAISEYQKVIDATQAVEQENARLALSYQNTLGDTSAAAQKQIFLNNLGLGNPGEAIQRAQNTYVPTPSVPPGPTPTPLTGGKGGGASAATIKSITLELERMFKVLPGNTKALADFINQLNQVTPGRGLKLADDLIAARDQIVAIQKEYGKVLAIQQAQVVVQDDINKLTAQQSVLELQTQQATIGYQIQINQLDQQSLAIKQQMLPIENAIAAIDRQIAAIQATNYAGEALSLENQLAQARIQQQMLPTQQKIADIEKQITDSVNQRTLLLQQQQELQQGKSADTTQYALDQVQAKLKAAFNSKDYTQVVALEQQQYALEQTLIAQKDQLKLTQDHNKLTQDDNAITQNALKLQEQGYIDILKPLGDQLYLLQQQGATIDANQKIIQLENSIAINALNQQKAALEKALDPLKQQLTAIQQQRDAIQLNIDKINALRDAQKLQLDKKLDNDKQELASLQNLGKNEDDRFANMVQGFVKAQTASGDFTQAEAANSIKVLGYWDNNLDKIQKLIDQFGSEKAAAQAVVDTIALIKDKTVTITIKYVTEGSPSSFAEGGVVGGPAGSPQLIIAHGGEQFLGVGVTTPVSTQRPGIGNSAQQVVNNYYNYEVNASYKQQQSPSNVGMDLRSLIAMTSR